MAPREQFRITASSGRPLALPGVRIRPVIEVIEGAFLELGPLGHVAEPERDFPTWELSEVLGRLDEDTGVEMMVERVSGFTDTWGTLEWPANDHQFFGTPDLPPMLVNLLRASKQAVNELSLRSDHKYGPNNVVHISALVTRARIVQALTGYWDQRAREVRAQEQLDAWSDAGLPRPTTTKEADQLFVACLNAALFVYPSPSVAVGPGPALEVPSAYTRACVEIYNRVVAGKPYFHCERDDCGRLFTSHRGRAQAGQNRTKSMKYCSHQCSSVVAMRRKRARDKVAVQTNAPKVTKKGTAR